MLIVQRVDWGSYVCKVHKGDIDYCKDFNAVLSILLNQFNKTNVLLLIEDYFLVSLCKKPLNRKHLQ